MPKNRTYNISAQVLFAVDAQDYAQARERAEEVVDSLDYTYRKRYFPPELDKLSNIQILSVMDI